MSRHRLPAARVPPRAWSPFVLLALLLPAAAVTALPAAPARPAPARVAAAVASDPDCPDPGEEPGTGGPPGSTDANVAVFAGGGLTVGGSAAEAEGLVVTLGDVVVDKASGGRFNVGTVGAGSQITPPAGTEMLVVGGDLTVGATTTLDIGSGASGPDGTLRGGALAVDGTITRPDRIETNGGAVVNPSTAAQRYAGFPAELAATSTDLASRTATGTVTGTTQLTFAGDGTSSPQVFRLTAAQLSAATEFVLTGVPVAPSGAYSPVVVDVVGGPAVTLAPTFYSIDGTRVDDLASDRFGPAASALLWNLSTATDVTVGGSSQVLGSILVPSAGATVDVTASTNGRLYTGGDLVVRGDGNELHNYPWRGDEAFDCRPEPLRPTGSVRVRKVLPGGSPFADALFRGGLRCTGDGNVLREPWTVRGGGATTLVGLPVGETCTLLERLDLVTDDHGDPVELGDRVWAEPRWSVDGQDGASFTVRDGVEAQAVVRNQLLGGFSVRKVLVDPDGAVSDDDPAFTARWRCGGDGHVTGTDGLGRPTDVRSGALVLTPGTPAVPRDGDDELLFPVGTTCAVTEVRPADGLLRPGHHWAVPTVAPATFVVGRTGAGVVVRMTNRVVPDPTSPAPSTPAAPSTSAASSASSGSSGGTGAGGAAGAGGATAATGVPVRGLALLALGLLLGGALLVAAARRPDRTGRRAR